MTYLGLCYSPLVLIVDIYLEVNQFCFATLPQVATVLDQLHKFLGPELKAVTGESAGIDEIMDRVEGLALPLNKVSSTRAQTRGLKWG